MLNHSFTFNGHSSDEFGIKIERFRALNRPARKYDSAAVPGRNGNIYSLQNAWDEVLVSYQIWAQRDTDLEDKWTGIMEWLNSADGYAELTDTYDTEHYREAVFVDATDIENIWNRTGRALISFRCRPERFLVNSQIALDTSSRLGTMTTTSTSPMTIDVYETANTSAETVGQIYSGELFEILSTSGSWYQVQSDTVTGWVQNTYVVTMTGSVVVNPTKHIAKPMITFTFNGDAQTVGINNIRIGFGSGRLGIGIIDCENEDVRGDTGDNLNPYITITDSYGNATAQFMRLKSGRNYIIYDSATTIDARFWEI